MSNKPKRIKAGTYIPQNPEFDPVPWVLAGVMTALLIIAAVHYVVVVAKGLL